MIRKNLKHAIGITLLAAAFVAGSIDLTLGATLVLPAASRTGTYVSPDAVIPAQTVSLALSLDGIPTADYEDTANSVVFEFDMASVALNVGDQCDPATCQHFQGFTWTGGHYVDPKRGINPMPGIIFDPRPWLGRGLTHVRVNATVGHTMIVGARVDTQ